MFECPAIQCERDWHSALFSPAVNTMQVIMWQGAIVLMAHYIMHVWFCVLGASFDVLDDASTSSS